MKKIELSQGQVTLVDDEWYEELSQWKWYAIFNADTSSFYAVRNNGVGRKRRLIRMGRVVSKCPDGMVVDHIDHDTLNNQSKNLRVCTNAENNRNKGKRINNTSGYKGVHLFRFINNRKRWRASIVKNKIVKRLGLYDTPEDAARAYDEAAKEYHGEFAMLNFPSKDKS